MSVFQIAAIPLKFLDLQNEDETMTTDKGVN
jgi:hypothetical protein